MKSSGILLLVVLISVGTTSAGLFFFSKDINTSVQEWKDEISSVRTDLAVLQTQQLEILTRLDDYQTALTKIQSTPIRVATSEFAGKQDSFPQATSAVNPGMTAQTESSTDDFNIDAAILDLVKNDLSYEDAQPIWQQIKEHGLIDKAVELFEQRVKQDPNNPDVHVELADAYVQKLLTVQPGPQQGVWGQKADQARDAALALDENHWQARFDKAVGLTFWPPIFGKQPEAIKHFSILLEQQESQPKKSQFAQTYIFLGNLYQQRGEIQKAREVWQKGTSLFPDNKTLLEQLELTK